MKKKNKQARAATRQDATPTPPHPHPINTDETYKIHCQHQICPLLHYTRVIRKPRMWMALLFRVRKAQNVDGAPHLRLSPSVRSRVVRATHLNNVVEALAHPQSSANKPHTHKSSTSVHMRARARGVIAAARDIMPANDTAMVTLVARYKVRTPSKRCLRESITRRPLLPPPPPSIIIPSSPSPPPPPPPPASSRSNTQPVPAR